jgi:hypothetical protein
MKKTDVENQNICIGTDVYMKGLLKKSGSH